MISSLANALEEALGSPLDLIGYNEHAIGHGTVAALLRMPNVE